ncbi:flagellar M-ring protein FliF [Spirochaetia bacterium]|nr:flagellar M-ring protein FliF [Spirochaetia bacterium]
MNEWLKNFFTQLKELWAKWGLIQKLILGGICAAVIAGVIALFSVSSSPTLVPVIDAPIRDQDARDRIVTRINEENIRTFVSAAGIVQVEDEQTARRMRSLLIREDLIPTNTDPWAIFDRERWTLTDFERNINKRRAQEQLVTDHITALQEVDDAIVSIGWPEDKLFRSEQNPVTASVTLFPRPGSDLAETRKKIEGIQKILKYAIVGLKDENIVITDAAGNPLNDFTGMAAMDRIKIIEQETKLIAKLERDYRQKILDALQLVLTADRVRDLNIKIDMDMSKKAVSKTEFFPYTLKPRTPGLPYDDSEVLASVPRSEYTSDTSYQGTGYNPEGPPGVEGQTAPAFKDMSNLWGTVKQEIKQVNHELNKEETQEEKSPSIDRVTVSVIVDGVWKMKYDEKKNPVVLPDNSIEREYIPVSTDDIRKTQLAIQDAIGYSAARGDSVSVQNIQFDRRAQFSEEDAAYFRQKQFQTTVIIFVSGVVLLFLAFIIFRAVSRELERRKRLAEEERARREAAMRENAMLQAEQEGMDVSISVEERTRLELQENVANMAKEHPEDVAALLRTWLREE